MEENCKKIELKLSVGSICYEIFSNGDNTYNVVRTLYIYPRNPQNHEMAISRE